MHGEMSFLSCWDKKALALREDPLPPREALVRCALAPARISILATATATVAAATVATTTSVASSASATIVTSAAIATIATSAAIAATAAGISAATRSRCSAKGWSLEDGVMPVGETCAKSTTRLGLEQGPQLLAWRVYIVI